MLASRWKNRKLLSVKSVQNQLKLPVAIVETVESLSVKHVATRIHEEWDSFKMHEVILLVGFEDKVPGVEDTREGHSELLTASWKRIRALLWDMHGIDLSQLYSQKAQRPSVDGVFEDKS